MSQSLLGLKNLTPGRRRGRGSLCSVGKAVCARAEPQLSTPYMCKCKPSPTALCTHPEVHHVRPGCPNSAVSWSWTAKRHCSELEGRRCQNGGLRFGVGETPPKSLEFKNLKNDRSPPPSSLLSSWLLCCSLSSLSPSLSLPLSLSLGVPSPVCQIWSAQHTLCICLQGICLCHSTSRNTIISHRDYCKRQGWVGLVINHRHQFLMLKIN